jgi:hypothetical protein
MCRSLSRYLLPISLVAFFLPTYAQNHPTSSPRTPISIAELKRRAGSIFVGTVSAVRPLRERSSGRVVTVQIQFHVEQGIRGVRNGQIFRMREWAGLWSQGERYRVGQRMVLFLYAPSALGLTSPVNGSAGRFDVDRNGFIVSSLLSPVTLDNPVRAGAKKSPVKLREFSRSIRRSEE